MESSSLHRLVALSNLDPCRRIALRITKVDIADGALGLLDLCHDSGVLVTGDGV